MCCLLTALVIFGPRLGILVWWLGRPVYVEAGINGNWILAILGWLFLPWSTLMYLMVYPGGVVGFDWIILGIGLLADIGTYVGSGYGHRGGHYDSTYNYYRG
jgi:hypothetical protein